MIDKKAINLGLVLAACTIIFTLLTAIADFGMITFFVLVLVLFIVMAIILVKSTLKIKKENDGVITFMESFKYMATAVVISGIISTAFSILYFQLIDPTYAAKMIDKTLEWTSSMMQNSGVGDSAIEKQLTDIETDMTKQFAVTGQLISFLKSTAVWIIFAAIVSLIIKKEQTFQPKQNPIDQF